MPTPTCCAPAMPCKAAAPARRQLVAGSGRRREPPGSNRHRHADERIRRKHTCATPRGCRHPGPDGGRPVAVDLASPDGADPPSKAQVGAGHLRSGPHVRIVARALLRGRVVAERKESSGSLPRHDPIPREPITRNGHGETIASGRTSGPTPPRAVVRRIRPALSGSACASPG